jgi:hypothetical protein
MLTNHTLRQEGSAHHCSHGAYNAHSVCPLVELAVDVNEGVKGHEIWLQRQARFSLNATNKNFVNVRSGHQLQTMFKPT